MDGMIRSHPSTGIHDPLFSRALVLANSQDKQEAFAVVSVDVCALRETETRAVRRLASSRTGIPIDHIIIAATHTHSGPATFGFFNPTESEYVERLVEQITGVIAEAAGNLRPASVGCAAGQEKTISHYRRLLADDGHVVMNWEPFPPERIAKILGIIDAEVGVLKATAAGNPGEVECLLFNHAGHPNVLSGDNYLLSSEYPGLAEQLLEQEFGGTAMFLNGAEGTMDVDGLRDRDWEGLERTGKALAHAVADTARRIVPRGDEALRGASVNYTVPPRVITEGEWQWAQKILANTGGKIQAMADGVGDDYKAVLYRDLRAVQENGIPVEQICFAIGDTAFLSFPGELYTEIGLFIKAHSPFAHTYILGLANGYIGYVPTRQAIKEGGYAEDIRRVDATAEQIIVEQSLALLGKVSGVSNKRGLNS